MMKWTKCAIRFLRISRPGVRVPSIAPNHENPNHFSIGEGFGFFVFFGNENNGSSLTAVCPKPYQKRRITKVTTVKVPYPVNQSDHNIGQFGVFLGFGSNRA